jgi:hypothetical protein
MNQLFNKLCDLAAIEATSPIREKSLLGRQQDLHWEERYGWSFP